MKYAVFFEVKLMHAFTSSVLNFITVDPTASSLKMMRANGLLLKQTSSGFKVLIPVSEQGNQVPVFKAEEHLSFGVHATSNDFVEFTDVSKVDSDNVMLFSNQNLNNGEFDLEITGAIPNERLKGFPEVAQIEIFFNSISSGATQDFPVYKAIFNSKSVVWKYYFITKDDGDLLSVSHRDIAFQKISDIAVDPVVNGLTANFESAGLNIKVFQSEEALQLQHFPRKDIQLKNDNITIINHLPNPEISDRGIKIIRIN